MANAFAVQVMIDKDYQDGYRQLRNLFKMLAPQCEPMDTLTGLVSQINNYIAGLREDDRTQKRVLRKIADIGDTTSERHHKRFGTGPGEPVANGWRVADTMREIALEALGE